MVWCLHRLDGCHARRSTHFFGSFRATYCQADRRASFSNPTATELLSKSKAAGRMKSRAYNTKAKVLDKDDFPKFSELLHAASHSSEDADIIDSWSSSSDTDEHDAVESNVTNLCRFSGCLNAARSCGLCPTHGGGTRCRIQGCMKHVVSGGLCVAHGGIRRCRGSPSCSSTAVSRGLCVQHGGGRKCSNEGCNKHVASGGRCRTHGGGRRCQVPDCTSSAQSRGLCYVHGGGGRCQREGCGSSAKKGGFCIAHGGGHRCQVAGCTSSAVSGARCRAHGGGRRCAVEGCTSSAKTGGRCIAHGGGKRCTVSGCTSSAQRLGLCKAHGGGRRCIVESCANSAVSRGRCIAHGGGKRCVFEGCTTTARKGGFCFAHGGRSTASTKSKPVSPVATKRAWSLTEIHSPIPALTLPPRRMLPPLNTMLMANRPGILRRSTPIPPIRTPVVSLEQEEQTTSNESAWQLRAVDQSTYPQTPTSSTRSGYSWQRLQETIRRESRVHGITNGDDDAAFEDKIACKVEDNEMHDSVTNDGFYWTRSRGPIPS
ncbi:hypothetical protein L917_20299 [Phytophthora nicotianae]|uniref:WRKY19-like zinc finger domain-containing protein n=1 Tax=Phytophthora nicotianae TaxID=4792 RepID=W2K1G1_PHYNI|nr:hypothetical protein L917_20299 [Phytophthora nicotianae]